MTDGDSGSSVGSGVGSGGDGVGDGGGGGGGGSSSGGGGVGVLGEFCKLVEKLAGAGMDNEALEGASMKHSNDYSQFSNWYSETELAALKATMEGLRPEPNAATEHARRYWLEERGLSVKQQQQQQQRRRREQEEASSSSSSSSSSSGASGGKRSLADVLRPTERGGAWDEEDDLNSALNSALNDGEELDDGIGSPPRSSPVGSFRVPLASGQHGESGVRWEVRLTHLGGAGAETPGEAVEVGAVVLYSVLWGDCTVSTRRGGSGGPLLSQVSSTLAPPPRW